MRLVTSYGVVGVLVRGHLVPQTAKEHLGGEQHVVEASHGVVEVGEPVQEFVGGHGHMSWHDKGGFQVRIILGAQDNHQPVSEEGTG